MPTYDYECGVCGFAGEYTNVPNSSHPPCRQCGDGAEMHRLPPRVNIGGLEARQATARDTQQEVIGLAVKLSRVECPCGRQGIKIDFKKIRDNPKNSCN